MPRRRRASRTPPAPPEPAAPASAPPIGQLFTLVTLAAILVYVAALPLTIARGSYDVWGGLLLAPLLVLLSMPVLRLVARRDPEPWLFQLLTAALAVKLLGALFRYVVTINVLGAADASAYHRAGAEIAHEFRAWDFSGPAFQEYVPEYVGTPFIRLVTGVIYTVTGPTKLGGFVVFSWLGFWGLYLCYRAFCIAIPNGNRRLYAVAVFFLPSLVFWPSSIGKEAWMQFSIGLCVYGVARILTHGRGGFVILAVGLWAAAMVRPHMSLIVFFALAIAYLVRPQRQARAGPPAPTKLVGILVLVVIGGILIGQTQSFFGVDASGTTGVDQVLERVESQSSQGGSEFDNVRPTSPAEFPWAAITVLFRPFPFEAGSFIAVMASIEGMVVLALLVRAGRRLLLVVRIPYALFAATYAALFIFAFSAVANFGILVRQRTQVLPLVLVLAALPAIRTMRELEGPPRPRIRQPRRRGAPKRASGDAGRQPRREPVGTLRDDLAPLERPEGADSSLGP